MDRENKYGTLNHQLKLLELIKEINNLCNDNCIKYSLCGGSLLGAIRHKGFIPWDDDMDIAFTRENYNKFKKAVEKDCRLNIIQDIWVPRIIFNDGTHNMDLCVDIFIFDNVPEPSILNSLKVFVLKIIQGMMKKNPSFKNYTFAQKILILATFVLGLPFSFSFKKKMYSYVSQSGNKKSAVYINTYNDLYRLLHLKYPKAILNSYTKVPFEDIELYVMEGYDAYLTIQYGDYMTPPPVSEQKPMHVLKNKE